MSEDYRRRLRHRERLRETRALVEARRAAPLRVVEPPAPPLPWASEADFMRQLVATLTDCGWQTHHETDSRKTNAGFPDLVAVRPPRVLVIELKRDGEQPKEEQRWWGEDLARCPGVEYYLWYPSRWDTILGVIAPPGSAPARAADVVEAIAPAAPEALRELRRRSHG